MHLKGADGNICRHLHNKSTVCFIISVINVFKIISLIITHVMIKISNIIYLAMIYIEM